MLKNLHATFTGTYLSFLYLTSMSIRKLTLLHNVIPKTGRHYFHKHSQVFDLLIEL